MPSSQLLDPSLGVLTGTLLQQLSEQAGYTDYAVLVFSLLGFAGYLSNGKVWNKQDPNHYKWFTRPQDAICQEATSKETRDVARKLEESNKDLVVFWGSQSGTAEGFAHRLARECHRRFRLEVLVADLSDYDPDTIALIPASKFAIFIMSTYGEGDPSDNASEFWEWMKDTSVDLSKFKYAAFGLGNTNYKYYNKVIDTVVETLNALKATSLLSVGRADDANSGTEEDFIEWKDSLFSMFQAKLGLPQHEQEYEPTMKVVEDTSLDIIDLHIGEPMSQMTNKKTASQTSAIGLLPIKMVKELTTGGSLDRNCLHMELDISDHLQIKYKTGDHLSVYPINQPTEIDRLFKVLDLSSRKDTPLLISSLDPSNNKLRIPSPTSLRALFTSYLEISAPVSRETAQALMSFAPSDTIRSILRTITSDKTAYSTFLSSNYITLSSLLEYTISKDASSSWSHLPLSFILESLQPMSPRHYSISSSSATSPKQLSITVANASTPVLNNPSIKIPGLASSYISTFSQNDSLFATTESSTPSVYASIRRSTFKLPTYSKAPLILIGAGTGIAPLRAFIHERAALANMGRETGEVLFFYGCRNPDQDYLYREEIEGFVRGALKDTLKVVTAFSRARDNQNQTGRCYVQHRISEPENARHVARLMLDGDAVVFFCGSTKMAKDAGDAVMNAVRAVKGFDEEEMLRWRDERRRVGRWKEDVWG